ncbi:MAG: FAD-dependent oxidoreductase [Acidimicrobiia bacterium]|nr:FAD-dependent oxidoreductase [Acidimicrobiia bacterium]MDX2468013.1 FAD-dependent oxidoreductase [Acidimicrobiia bacterium]
MSSQLEIETAVLGAGLAGLGFAIELPGVRIFEAKQHPGGHAYSHQAGGVFFDEGAHISHTKDSTFRDLIHQTAGAVHTGLARSVRNRWHGVWTGYPVQNHLRDLPEEARISALIDLVVAHTDATEVKAPTYRDWCTQQYGDYLTDNFYEEFTTKYWRRATSELATDWLGGRLIPSDLPNIITGAFSDKIANQATFATFHYPKRGGFFGFFEDLYADLDIRFGSKVADIDLHRKTLSFESGAEESFERLASSIPLPTLINAIKDVPASVRDAAGQLHHTKMLCVNVIVERTDLIDSPWCYIYDHDIEPARISFPANLSPGSVPGGSSAIQAEIFRDHNEPWGDQDALAEATVQQLGDLLGFDPQRDVTTVHTIDVSHAYVVSDHNRANAVDHVLSWLSDQQVTSMGLYGKWKYLWSDAAFRSGQQAAANMKAQDGHN